MLNNIKTPKIYKILIKFQKDNCKTSKGSGSVGIIKYNKDIVYKK